MADMRAFYEDVKGRMVRRGRAIEECAILAASRPSSSGETESIARERADYLRSLVDARNAGGEVSGNLGADVSKMAKDANLADPGQPGNPRL